MNGQAYETQPGTQQPQVTQPGTQPGTQQPQVTQPGTQQPQVTQPETQQPQVTQPGTQQPQVTQPGTQQPQVTQPGTQQNNMAYDSIIAQQQAQIEALINANNSLTQQVTQMVQNGAQFYQPQPQTQTKQQTYTPALSDNVDYSLEALAQEIGKRDDLPPRR